MGEDAWRQSLGIPAREDEDNRKGRESHEGCLSL